MNNYQNIISLLGQMLREKNTVVWICTPGYQKQLYVSPSFKEVWGREPSELYDNPERWADFLVKEEGLDMALKVYARNPTSTDQNYNTSYYRILHPSGEIRYIRDMCFHLYDSNNQVVAIVGIAKQITDQEWFDCIDALKSDAVANIAPEITIGQILQKQTFQHLPVNSKTNTAHYVYLRTGNHLQLSWREYCCLAFLFQGKTAKETAKILEISHRSVEKYFENIKYKFGCSSKIDFFKKIHPANLDWLVDFEMK